MGSSLGGFVVGHYGVASCFITDSLVFLLSACILAVKVNGDYSVSVKGEKHQRKMVKEVVTYLAKSDASPFLLFKGCGVLLFGASDVINVTFSQVDGIMDSQRLGWMFTAVGAGCLLGPLAMPAGRSYATTCVGSFLIVGLGYGLIGCSEQFWLICLWTVLRSAGVAVLWIDSSIILQTTTPSTFHGRISAIDVALATLGEAISALTAGLVQDNGVSAKYVTFILSVMGCLLAVMWSTFMYFRERLQLHNEVTAVESIELKPLQESVVV